MGGTDILIHKYLGPKTNDEGTADQPVYNTQDPRQIQDLLFLENRDRKYDPDIYSLRCVYNVQDNDFNLSQFAAFLDTDTLYMTVHINASVKTLGRKVISGDVIELPHLKDEYALDDATVALKRFYVVEDVTRASEGFSPTWYPHLYRLKVKQIVDAQEFKDILDLPADEEDPDGDTLRDLLSTYSRESQINSSVIAQAEADAPRSGYDVSHYYRFRPIDNPASDLIHIEQVDTQTLAAPRAKKGYAGYMLGADGIALGSQFGEGIQFPSEPENGDYFMRTDFQPARIFRYEDGKWIKASDNVRMTMTNSQDRMTQKTSFINNRNYTYNDLVASDVVVLEGGETVVNTKIQYPPDARYVVLKQGVYEKGYSLEDNPGLITADPQDNVQINLPVINRAQDRVEYPGNWDILFYDNREAQRQSLSKALRPKADDL